MIGRLTLRRRLLLLVTLGAALTLTTLTIAFNLLLRSNLDADANRLLAGQAATTLETITVRGGRLRVIEETESGAPDAPAWVFAESRTLEHPREPPDLQRLARSLIGTDGAYAESADANSRLYSLAIENHGLRGTIVSGISLEPYESSEQRALIGSLLFAGAFLIITIGGVRLVVAGALRPVARITAEAAEWSEKDLGHRFNVAEPHDELTALAATFDGMLDRLEESLRHEQRFTAEVSHELRTPLAAIIAESELALRRERRPDEYRRALTAVAERAHHLHGIIEALLAAARAESSVPGERCDAAEVAEAVAHRDDSRRDLQVQVASSGAEIFVATDRDTAERILAPLVANAVAHAATRVQLTVDLDGEQVRIVVSDDGPGVPPEERRRVFEPGHRASEASAGGAGLGLALARRLAQAVGGDVSICPDDAPGGCFVVRLPAA